MRKPTTKERAAFKCHAEGLAALGRAGFHIYLAEDALHLMTGPSHDVTARRIEPRQDRVRETIRIPLAGGGDW